MLFFSPEVLNSLISLNVYRNYMANICSIWQPFSLSQQVVGLLHFTTNKMSFTNILGKRLSDCMVFNTIFNSISVILWLPVHLSMLSWNSFNQYSVFFPSNLLLSLINIVEAMHSGERGMNLVAMTIINL